MNYVSRFLLKRKKNMAGMAHMNKTMLKLMLFLVRAI